MELVLKLNHSLDSKVEMYFRQLSQSLEIAKIVFEDKG